MSKYFLVLVAVSNLFAVVFGEEVIIRQDPRFVISHDQNPFREDASLHARISFIDRASPSLSWFTMMGTFEKDGVFESYLKHESIKRIMGLDKETSELLDKHFQQRIDTHKINIQKLEGPRLRESAFLKIRAGMPRSAVPNASLPETPDADIKKYLVEYAAAELKAEKQLVEQLDEILLPSQLPVLVHEWWDLKKLHIPIVAAYLDLTDAQIKDIQVACDEAFKVERKIIESYTGSDIKERNELLLANAEWRESNFKPLVFLTPSQFRLVAHTHLLPWKKSKPTFSQRLEELSKATSPFDLSEKKILTDLYLEGRKLERDEN